MLMLSFIPNLRHRKKKFQNFTVEKKDKNKIAQFANHKKKYLKGLAFPEPGEILFALPPPSVFRTNLAPFNSSKCLKRKIEYFSKSSKN